MNYLVTVADNNIRLERIVFSNYDVAVYFVERRRKQGYVVTMITVESNKNRKGETKNGNH